MSGSGRKKKGLVKSHHGYTVGIFIAGCLLPPIAVAMRFGIGRDFFINVLLTICGYFPSHGHNFYIQNIRNNKGRGRTPKWALKAGLVEDTSAKKARKREWANRYAERTGRNTYDEEGYEDENGNFVPGTHSGADALARNRREAGQSANAEDHDLYAPGRVDSQDSSVIEAALEGDRDPGHTRLRGFGDLPGAGERNKKSSGGGFRGLMGSGKSGRDRHARMEAERERHHAAYDDDAQPLANDDDFLNQDLHAGPRAGTATMGGNFRRPTGRTSPQREASDPLGAVDFLDQDLHQGSGARTSGGLSKHRAAAASAKTNGVVVEDRYVDTSGNLDHRF